VFSRGLLLVLVAEDLLGDRPAQEAEGAPTQAKLREVQPLRWSWTLRTRPASQSVGSLVRPVISWRTRVAARRAGATISSPSVRSHVGACGFGDPPCAGAIQPGSSPAAEGGGG